MTDIHKLIYSEPCPKCGIYIEKNGGCIHMTCGKCSHQFCWYCLGEYRENRHVKNIACPFRYIATVGCLALLFILLN